MIDFKKSLIINISIIVGVCLVSFLLIFYFQKKINMISEEIYKYKSELALYTLSISNLAKLKEISPQADLYFEKLKNLLPPKDKLIDLSNFVSDNARASQVQLSFSFTGGGQAPQNDSPGFENFSINVSGEIENILKFLNLIEEKSSKFLINIKGFNLNQTDKNSYRFSGEGQVFYINE